MTAMGETTGSPPAFAEALRTWARIGCLSFGGPAGQIALMHRVLVDEKKWLDERSFLSALNFCMLLPGPEAMQLATYAGWRLHGTRGGLAAGLLFVGPGALVMLVLSLLYASYGTLAVVQAVFLGVKAAVLAIVVEALLRISRRALRGRLHWLIAGVAFVAIFAFQAPFPLIVVAAALIGYLLPGDGAALPVRSDAPRVAWDQTLRTAALWLAIWILPLLAVAWTFGPDHVLSRLAWFFSKLAVVTFGGAYAVLAYMSQEVVQVHGWLSPGAMLDALGLAETTPGPLILVTQFVGTLAAWTHGGGSPLLMGLAGAAVALWATFAPCFMWIFVGAPYIERLNADPRLRAALGAITSAVVGVILNLTVWFGLHVLFGRVAEMRLGPLSLQIPDLSTLDPVTFALSALAILLLFVLHRGILATLAVCGAAAMGWHLLAA